MDRFNYILNEIAEAVRSHNIDSVLDCDETEYLSFCIELFSNPNVLSKYDRVLYKREEEYEVSLADEIINTITKDLELLLYKTTIPMKLRIKVIESIYILFKEWFIDTDISNMACYMFWDTIIPHDNEISIENTRIKGEIYECLSNILRLKSIQCQGSAIHGFNHLKDSRCKKLLLQYIDATEDEEMKEFAMLAREYKLD